MEKDKELKDTMYREDNPLYNDVFKEDQKLEFIFKKTEKIVTAMYLVTNFFSSDEPLKRDIRQVANKTLRSIMSLMNCSAFEKETRIKTVPPHAIELSSLFDISYRAGLVSTMNFDILNTEIFKISEAIVSYQKDSASSLSLGMNPESFEVSLSELSKPVSSYRTNFQSKGHDELKHKSQNVFYGTVKDLKDKLIGNYDSKKISTHANTNKKFLSNSKRRSDILSEVNRRGVVSVKDIALVVTDCSEKTLQRELLSLVSEGVLSKTGERRWSKYSIKK